MRFKKGTKVEVLSKKEVPSGSWHCAEIIGVNGRNYKVRYEGYSDETNETIVEMVSRKAIRPCPSVHGVSDNWVRGDVVEVFYKFSWMMATVLAVLENKYVLVRVLGSSLEFKVRKVDVRMRQLWQDNEWVVIGKGSGSCEDVKHGESSTLRYNQTSTSQFQNTFRRTYRRTNDECGPVNTKVNYQDPVIDSSKNLKRGSCFHVEAHTAAGQKHRVVERNERLYRLVVTNPSVLEQVDAVAFEVHGDRRKPNGAVGCYFPQHLETNDADSVTCSVGSCSVRLPRVSACPIEVADGECSDTGSFCPRGDEEGNRLLHTKKQLAAEMHKIELRAYRCTLEALHASGPLSWEQEALVTNLRRSLHISNDEHLTELRNLNFRR